MREPSLMVLERANQPYGVEIPATRFSAPSAAAVSPFAGQFRCDTVVDYGSAPLQMPSMADQGVRDAPGHEGRPG